MKLRIRERRLLRGWTQGRLAACLGVSAQAVNNMEHRADLRVSTLCRVAAALGCTVAELLATD